MTSISDHEGALEVLCIEPDGYEGALSPVDEAWVEIGIIDLELENTIKALRRRDQSGLTSNRSEILNNENVARIKHLVECIFGRLETLHEAGDLSKLNPKIFDWGTIEPTFDAIIGDVKEFDVGDAIDAYQTISDYTHPFRADLHYGPDD